MADVDLAQLASKIGTNPPGGKVGPPIASAASITLTHGIHHITGTAAISTIVPPLTGNFQGEVTLIADAAWTLATGGTEPNDIAKAVTAVANEAIDLVHDGSTWFPKIADGA
mgnify:CR=1 FL=1